MHTLAQRQQMHNLAPSQSHTAETDAEAVPAGAATAQHADHGPMRIGFFAFGAQYRCDGMLLFIHTLGTKIGVASGLSPCRHSNTI